MAAMIDLFGSYIFGAVLLLLVVGLSVRFSTSRTTQNLDLIAQQNLSAIRAELEQDMRQAGYGISAQNRLLYADTSEVVFAYMPSTGTQPTVVRYWLDPSFTNAASANPRDRVLRRFQRSATFVGGAINWATETATIRALTTSGDGALGLVRFRLDYFRGDNVQTTTPVSATDRTSVRSARVQIVDESDFGLPDDRGTWVEGGKKMRYGSAVWSQVIFPVNLTLPDPGGLP